MPQKDKREAIVLRLSPWVIAALDVLKETIATGIGGTTSAKFKTPRTSIIEALLIEGLEKRGLDEKTISVQSQLKIRRILYIPTRRR